MEDVGQERRTSASGTRTCRNGIWHTHNTMFKHTAAVVGYGSFDRRDFGSWYDCPGPHCDCPGGQIELQSTIDDQYPAGCEDLVCGTDEHVVVDNRTWVYTPSGSHREGTFRCAACPAGYHNDPGDVVAASVATECDGICAGRRCMQVTAGRGSAACWAGARACCVGTCARR